MKTEQAKAKKRTFVNFLVEPNGEVWAKVMGQNGSLAIQLQGGRQGDDPTITIVDPERSDNKKYKACWALQANGHLRGWLVDEDGRIKWFPERAKPKRKRTTKAPPLRGKAKRPSK